MTKIYKDTNRYGVTLTIHYVDTVEKVLDPVKLNLFFSDIHENTFRYMGNVFDGLSLDIWDDLAPDIPHNTVDADGHVNLGIGDSAGLTWAWLNKMEINDNLYGGLELGRDNFMSNILSHESGHLIADKLGFNDVTNALRTEWYKIRAIDSKPGTAPGELIAEDIRLLFGARGAKGYLRGNYKQATDVRGLLDFYKIWKTATDWLKSFKEVADIEGVGFEYSSWDFAYAAVFWHVNYHNPLWKFFNKSYRIDRNGIYQSNSKNGWDLLKGL